MKLIGMLSFFDEDPRWLTEAISSHKNAGLTHLVAVDGAYALLPDGRASSPAQQHKAIERACKTHGINLTLHIPDRVWEGNEIEKRSFMFRLALAVADGPQDWLMVIDADHLMTNPDDLPALLSETELHVAEFTAWQGIDAARAKARGLIAPRLNEFTIRLAYRANPGLHCRENHYTYVDGEGRVLWGSRDAEPALDLTHVRIEHRTTQRAKPRHETQRRYYNVRTEAKAELGPSNLCDWPGCTSESEDTVPFEFELIDGTHALRAGGIKVCAKHARRVHHENRARLARMGRHYGERGELLARYT